MKHVTAMAVTASFNSVTATIAALDIHSAAVFVSAFATIFSATLAAIAARNLERGKTKTKAARVRRQKVKETNENS